MATKMEQLAEELAERLGPDYALGSPGPEFTENQRIVFGKRYPRKDEDGEPVEIASETIWRVALNVSAPEAIYAGESKLGRRKASRARVVDRDSIDYPFKSAVRKYNRMVRLKQVTNAFPDVMAAGMEAWLRSATGYQKELLTQLNFLPNSPTWTGAGTKLGQLAACFVLPISDDLGRARDSIYETLKVAVLIQQTGGGNGFSFSHIRPLDAIVYRSMGKASGAVSFLEDYDHSFGKIAQGGSRRGANMGVLEISHPEIRGFIASKVEEGKIKNFNISVAVTDEFMRAVDEDASFDLVHDGKVYETIRARELFDEIIQKAWVIGDPGNLFIDKANRDNPNPGRYRLEATNPCGEQWLGPYENCCLGSFSLRNFANWDGTFDWERFRKTVVMATRFLDNVVDANAYVEEVPELEEAAEGGRRIGLGGMGLADALAILGLSYADELGREFGSQAIEFARYHCMLTSIELAKTRGPFEWIEGSIYDPKLLKELGPGAEFQGIMKDGVTPFTANLWKPPTPLEPHVTDFGRPQVDWKKVLRGIIRYGIRNCAQFTFAPTGTISSVAGLAGSGCEPFFALVYVRTMMQDSEGNIELHYLNPLFERALVNAGVSDEDREKILEELKEAPLGSCQGIDLVPDSVKKCFLVSGDITGEQHVRMQAALQRFIDNSISKTINMPNEATPEDIAEAYRLAYSLGCKGITIYRQGSRELEVLSTAGAKDGEIDAEHWPLTIPMPIPASAKTDGLPARVFPVLTPFGHVQTTVTELPGHTGRPFDVRLQLGKAGTDKAADIEAIGRLISLCFRCGVSVDQVVEQLEGIGGAKRSGFGPEGKVLSAPDGVAKTLARIYSISDTGEVSGAEGDVVMAEKPEVTPLNMSNVVNGEVCPKCLNATVVFEQGCKHCDVRLGGCGDYNACD